MMQKLLSFFLAIFSCALFADSSGDYIECIGEGSSEIVCWVATNDIDPPLVSTNIVMTKDHCEQIKRTVTESYNAIGSLIGNVSSSASAIRFQADTSEMNLMTYYNDILLIHDSLEQDLPLNPNETVSNNVVRLESLASNVYDLQPGYMAIKGEADQIKDRAAIISNILANVQSTVDRVKCVDGEECSSSGDGTVQCPCIDQFNSVVEAVERVRTELFSLHADATEAWAHLVQIEVLVSNVCESAEFIRNRLLAPDDRMWNDVLSVITNMVYASSNNIAAIEHRSLDISSLLQDIQRAVHGDLTDEHNIQLSNEGVIALYNLVGNFSTYSLLASGLSEFRKQFGIFSNTVYQLFKNFNGSVTGLNGSTGDNLYNGLMGRTRYLYRAATNYQDSALTRYVQLVTSNSGRVTNWFSRMEFYQQSLLGWYDTPESKLSQNVPEHKSSVEDSLETSTNSFSQIASVVYQTNTLTSIVSPMKEVVDKLGFHTRLPETLLLVPSTHVLSSVDISFSLDLSSNSNLREYCGYARNVTSLVWHVGFWALIVFICAMLVKGASKAALWFVDFITKI